MWRGKSYLIRFDAVAMMPIAASSCPSQKIKIYRKSSALGSARSAFVAKFFHPLVQDSAHILPDLGFGRLDCVGDRLRLRLANLRRF